MINLNDTEQKKEIRIFVSSTFQDMQGERDYLVKNVFPKLRKISQSRGVELTEVDLRWGVTEAQAKDGKVIEICLREINRCRPYFIGLLGERYGWIPETKEYKRHRRILEDFAWVKQDIDEQLSITEMEIQYGVLRNPAIGSRAFFYLRDPANTPREFCDEQGSVAAGKLSHLKSLLTSQKDYPCHQFTDPKDLEHFITADFEQFIDTEFREDETPTPLVRAQRDHAAFARSRLKIYLGGDAYFEQLDKHVDSTEQPLVVVGESGSGKSALLANWIAHHQKQYPDEFVLYHFISGAPDSSDHFGLLRRIMEEMKERFALPDEVPTEPERIAETLPMFLAQTPHAHRWVLVLDALNQLEEKGNARWLGWLPRFIPENIRVVVSTLPGESLDILKKREYPQLAVQPMDIDTRKQLIHVYLALFTKDLSVELVERIAGSSASSNPLILRALLDEIRIFGVHEKLEERIDYYLKPRTPIEFFDAVLQRLESDYELEHPGMVGHVLSLIWASRRGLSEHELLDITGIPPLFWAPLYNALATHLVSRAGLLGFFHDFLRQAVHRRYLENEDDTKEEITYLTLARYFDTDRMSNRAVEELPWLYRSANEWEQMANLFRDANFVQVAFAGLEFDFAEFWNDLENQGYSIVAHYDHILREPRTLVIFSGLTSGTSSYLLKLAKLLLNFGYDSQSLELCNSIKNIFSGIADDVLLEAAQLQTVLLHRRGGEGDYQLAIDISLEVFTLANSLNEILYEFNALGSVVAILTECKQIDEAERFLIGQKAVMSRMNEKEKRMCNANILASEAILYREKGSLQKALELHEKEEIIERQYGNIYGVQASLGNQATLLVELRNFDAALSLLEEQENICMKHGLKLSLANCFSNQAAIFAHLGQIEKASNLLDQQHEIAVEVGSQKHIGIAIAAKKALEKMH